MKKNKTQVDYTVYGDGYQLQLSINSQINIPKDDPVRLLSAVVERMNIEKLTASYSDDGRKEFPPRILLKLCIYGYMRMEYSSRAIERACKENIKYMYLLNGHKAPDHNTIARFRAEHLSQCWDEIQKSMTNILTEMGEVSFADSAVFIDGTKIESVGNRYKFVWKKGVEKHFARLQETMKNELPGMLSGIGIKYKAGEKVRNRDLKKLKKKIQLIIKNKEISKVSGKGKRKTPEQKVLDKINEWRKRQAKYINDIHICGERNSYCKTDKEATFMRMKEDHMLNGQLKPGYNVNVATVSEYIVGTYVSSDRTDTKTTIPFMKELMGMYPVKRVVYDSGYESEENYRFFEEHKELDLYVKPANHEQKKKRKYKNDISRRENMIYRADQDIYVCANGKELIKTGVKHSKTSSGYVSEKTIYECTGCKGCPLKEQCIKSRSNTPIENRNKRLEVAKYFTEQRENMEQKITTEEGKKLRMNRSIQAEGVFAYIKTDMKFRRFMLKGTIKTGTEWTLLSLAYNILRMHHKGLNGRLGTHLYDLAA